MTASGSNGATIGQLAAEWRERLRHGEQPEMEDYLNRYPQLADEIRELFPAVVVMEDLKGDAGALTGSIAADTFAVEARKLEHLGDFRILREIGRGGMGVVYEAEQESLSRRVALKVLPPQALLDPRYHKRFQREAKAAAKLHHTNIVPVFGVGEHERTCYYVMQFISGLGLDKVLEELKRQRQASGVASALRASALPPTGSYHAEADLSAVGVARSLLGDNRAATVRERTPQEPLPDGRGSELLSESGSHYWRSVARMGMQVAEALDYAGSQGILHRDIKPSNLLLDTRGNVWVTDFGLAKAGAEENLTHTGDVIGTLRYMAPERFEGRSDLRGDIYSLGLTLYELLTLQPAFGEKDRNTLIHQVTTAEPLSPRKIDPRIPRDLETIVLKAIARDPAHRYQTGTTLVEDLQRFVEDRPILARRVSLRERFWRWCRRNPVVASLIAAHFFGLTVGLIGVTTEWRRAESNAEQARRNEESTNQALGRALASENKLRNILYAADMNLVQAAWEAGNVNRVVQLLDRNLPGPGETDLRGFEWFYWRRQLHSETKMVKIPELAHFVDITTLTAKAAFNRDGTLLAVGVRSQEKGKEDVRLWDTVTGDELPVLPGGLHVSGFYSLELSPPGGRLAVQMNTSRRRTGNEVQVWDRRRRQMILSIPRGEHLAFSPDGRRLAVSIVGESEDKPEAVDRLKVWDLDSRKEIFARDLPGRANCVVYSSDGSRLALAVEVRDKNLRLKEGSLRILDAASGRELRTIPSPANTYPHAATFSPDGKRLAATLITSGSEGSGTIHAWDIADGKDLFAVDMPNSAIGNLRFSPDGKQLASWVPFSSTVALLDAASGKTAFTLRGHTRGILAVAFNSGGRRLQTASADGTVRTWAVGGADKPMDRQTPDVLAVESDSARIAVTFESVTKEVKILDRSGRQLLSLALPLGHPHGGAFSSDGRRLAILWHLDEGKKTYALKTWDTVTGAKLLDIPLSEAMASNRVAFSPDGRLLAACFAVYDKEKSSRILVNGVKMWDAGDGKEVASMEWRGEGTSMGVAFRPDGAHLAASFSGEPGEVRIWEVATRREVRTLQNGRGFSVGLTFSPDGKVLLASYGGVNDAGAVQAWNADTGAELFALTGHTGSIRDLIFSPDGRRIASMSKRIGGNRGEVKLWDARSGQELLSFPIEGRFRSRVLFRSNGRQLLELGGNSLADLIRVWDATPLPER